MDIEKRIQELRDRLKYILDIFGPDENANVAMLEAKLGEYVARESGLPKQEAIRQLETLEELFRFLEKKLLKKKFLQKNLCQQKNQLETLTLHNSILWFMI